MAGQGNFTDDDVGEILATMKLRQRASNLEISKDRFYLDFLVLPPS